MGSKSSRSKTASSAASFNSSSSSKTWTTAETHETQISAYSQDANLTHSPVDDLFYREASRPPKLELEHLERTSYPKRGDKDGHTRTAISESERAVYSNASGAVAGTLEGLVDRLVDNFSG